MWGTRSQQVDGGRVLRFAVDRGGRPATFAKVLAGWQEDAAFRSLFNSILAEPPFTSFRWETPPVSTASLTQPFEFVLLDSPRLARRPDPEAFAEHFGGGTDAEVVVFPNLGGDAVMVVPRPIAAPSAYGHLASLVREAPDQQRHALWQSVGSAMVRRVEVRPVWLSTAGACVS
jgi:hypothetical protein